MLSTIGTPISGRPCLLWSLLFLSVFGLLVAGSFGSASQVRAPQSAPPQLTILTLPFFSAVPHVPSRCAARAGARGIVPKVIAQATTSAVVRKFFMDGLPEPVLVVKVK